MAILIIIPGIALYGILGDSLAEPDMAFPYIVNTYLPEGIKGIILCGLFASLMSTVDSTFNSLATLWSTDIYSKYINKKANDKEKIKAGQRAILFSLGTALLMGMVLLYLKFDDPNSAFTHTLNNLRYYINCGIVVLICSAVILIKPRQEIVLFAFIATLPINISLQIFLPEMNYFVRAFWVILIGLSLTTLASRGQFNSLLSLFRPANNLTRNFGWALAISLILLHIIFH
jgi:SSS family solute:Na+ symporter